MSDYYEGLEEGIKVGRDEAAAEIARLRAACDAYFKTISLSQIRHGRILVGLERRNARHRRALAKLYQRRHDKNAEIASLRAEITTARLVPPLNPDRWRGAINDALTNWMDSILDDETPKDALRRLIKYEVDAALDPSVSQSAADLVAAARREGMKDAAKWHEVRSGELSGKIGLARNFRQLLRQSDFHMESAAAIRAAAKEGKP